MMPDQTDHEAMDSELKAILERLIKIEKLLNEQSLNSKDIFCFDEASNFLDLSKSYLYKLTSRGCFRPNGKKLYFERKGLLEWIKRKRISSNSEIHEIAIKKSM